MSVNLVGIAALALLLTVFPVDARAQAESANAKGDPVVAVVNGTEIHRSELIQAQQGLPPQYRSSPLEMIFPALVERLIDARLVTLEARKGNLQDDEDVRKRMAWLEDQVIQEAYLRRYVAGVATEGLLRQRYDEFLKLNPPREEVHARHILLETEADAKAVVEEIRGGADFVQLATEKSTGPSAGQGGDLGYFARGDMVAEFSEAAFSLEPGATTEEPVQTQFGWHVIKVEDRRLQDPPTFEETRESLMAEISQEAVGDLVEKLRVGAAIVRFNLDGSSKTE